ncbi:MAG: hypothetical protein JXJ22_07010 [Bacteroidales bacterium]|nr:hypothetical protein [Bacteroidales bacterium]
MNTIVKIHSYEELTSTLAQNKKTYLLLYKSGTEKSDCALDHLAKGTHDINNVQVLSADVNQVKDIHGQYSITSVPSLLEFNESRFINVIKGCHDTTYYHAVLENAVYMVESKNSDKPRKSVTVYSTPTCSWCNTLKSYLRKNRIIFTDIDVSRDEQAAKDMVNKSGQQGVPQMLVDGELIVGFDQKKINRLLEINA